MEWDIVSSSTRVSFRALVVQYFYIRYVLLSWRFDIVNHSDDSAPYCANQKTKFVIINLEQSSIILLEWLNSNYTKVNTGKSYLLLSGNSRAKATMDNSYIESEDEQVLLTITIDYINSICKKTSQKLNALARIATYMNIQMRRTIMNSFLTSQFGYYPLIWTLYSRHLNNKIDYINERALWITCQGNTSVFQELLNRDNFLSIHCKNL